MLSLALIERRIKEIVKGDHTDGAVMDFALLCLARDYLLAEIDEQEGNGRAADKPRVVLTNYCADLTTIPTVEQIGMAISSAASRINTPDDKRRLAVAQNWAEIISHKPSGADPR